MELIEVILSKENLNRAYQKVVANKGAGGIDGITVEELGDYIRENKDMIVTSIRNRTYMPKPVRRVYIPKENGKQRPLGIPTALDRTIQQAIAQPISDTLNYAVILAKIDKLPRCILYSLIAVQKYSIVGFFFF